MKQNKPFSVCVLVINPEGKVLGVTRKTDHNDWGLPVGKIETNEPHLVDWVEPVVVTKGSFGEFNKHVFDLLNINY